MVILSIPPQQMPPKYGKEPHSAGLVVFPTQGLLSSICHHTKVGLRAEVDSRGKSDFRRKEKTPKRLDFKPKL